MRQKFQFQIDQNLKPLNALKKPQKTTNLQGLFYQTDRTLKLNPKQASALDSTQPYRR